MLLCHSSASGEGAREGMCPVRPKAHPVLSCHCIAGVPGDGGRCRPPPHWPPGSGCAGRQGWGWKGVCSCLHGKECRDVCLQPLCCCSDFSSFACFKVVLMIPGLLSCLQISESFLLEQALKAACSLVTEASWWARCSPTSWCEQRGWGTACRYFFGQGGRRAKALGKSQAYHQLLSLNVAAGFCGADQELSAGSDQALCPVWWQRPRLSCWEPGGYWVLLSLSVLEQYVPQFSFLP